MVEDQKEKVKKNIKSETGGKDRKESIEEIKKREKEEINRSKTECCSCLGKNKLG